MWYQYPSCQIKHIMCCEEERAKVEKDDEKMPQLAHERYGEDTARAMIEIIFM